MIDITYWAMGTGITIIGIGLALFYEGQAFKTSDMTRKIGEHAFITGIIGITLGTFFMLLGFSIWLMLTFCTPHCP